MEERPPLTTGTLNTAEVEEEQDEVPPPLKLAVVRYMVLAEEVAHKPVVTVKLEVPGVLTQAEVVEPLVLGGMAVLARHVSLVLVMVAEEPVAEATVRVEMVESLAAEAEQAQEMLAATAAQAAQVAEARCVYGPGSSEYSRVIGHSRAEA